MTDEIRTTFDRGVMTIVMNRPDKKNALTDAMYGAFVDAIVEAEADARVRVTLVLAEGDMFTAGNDIAEFSEQAQGAPAGENVWRFMRALATAAKPIVAGVQGRAVGIGTTMLLHFDHVILADNAKLSTPFVSLALVPEAGSSLLLPQRVGHLRAFAMLAMGEVVVADQALEWGLANAVVPLADLRASAYDAAGRIAQLPIGSLVTTKALMRSGHAVGERVERERDQFLVRLASAEAREAFNAFTERRKPDSTVPLA